MSASRGRNRLASVAFGFTLPLLAGCPVTPSLPVQLDVATSATAKVTVDADTGPVDLANTVWGIFRKADPDEPSDAATSPGPYGGLLGGNTFIARTPPDTVMVRIQFADSGKLVRFTDNVFYLPQLFGRDWTVDGKLQPTTFPFLRFAAGSFGMSIGNRFGIAAPVQVLFGNILIGNAVAYAWGTVDGDRIDGQFGYFVELKLPLPILGSGGADQYAIYAIRETE